MANISSALASPLLYVAASTVRMQTQHRKQDIANCSALLGHEWLSLLAGRKASLCGVCVQLAAQHLVQPQRALLGGHRGAQLGSPFPLCKSKHRSAPQCRPGLFNGPLLRHMASASFPFGSISAANAARHPIEATRASACSRKLRSAAQPAGVAAARRVGAEGQRHQLAD